MNERSERMSEHIHVRKVEIDQIYRDLKKYNTRLFEKRAKLSAAKRAKEAIS